MSVEAVVVLVTVSAAAVAPFVLLVASGDVVAFSVVAVDFDSCCCCCTSPDCFCQCCCFSDDMLLWGRSLPFSTYTYVVRYLGDLRATFLREFSHTLSPATKQLPKFTAAEKQLGERALHLSVTEERGFHHTPQHECRGRRRRQSMAYFFYYTHVQKKTPDRTYIGFL